MPLSDDFWADDPEPSKSECHGCIWDLGGNCTADLRVIKCPLDVEIPNLEEPWTHAPAPAPFTVQSLATAFQAIDAAPLRVGSIEMSEQDFQDVLNWALP